MSIVGFFILLAIAILLKLIGNKLVSLLMPSGWLRTIAVGWVGGFSGSLAGSILWQFGPKIAGINLLAAAIGCALFILFLGILPFIRILLGKV